MKHVEAQFRPRWRPGRAARGSLAALAVCALLAVSVAVWEQRRIAALHSQIAEFIEGTRARTLPRVPPAAPAYDASARQFLRERAAGWAPMLRTLESGSMIGVTPTSVEFSATDGVARVELGYSDSTALIDYLGRINEGVSVGSPRWTLMETRVQAGGPAVTGTTAGAARDAGSVATIRSTWPAPVSEAASVSFPH